MCWLCCFTYEEIISFFPVKRSILTEHISGCGRLYVSASRWTVSCSELLALRLAKKKHKKTASVWRNNSEIPNSLTIILPLFFLTDVFLGHSPNQWRSFLTLAKSVARTEIMGGIKHEQNDASQQPKPSHSADQTHEEVGTDASDHHNSTRTAC